MTRFRDVQQAIIMVTVWVDNDKIKSDYNIKKKTWNYVCVVKPNDKTSDTNDDVTTKTNTKHMKRDTWQVNVHAVFLLVRFVVAHSLHTTSRGSRAWPAQVHVCFHPSHPCMKWALLFDFELSIPSNFLLFSFSFNLQQLLLPFYFHEDSSNTVYSAKREMGLLTSRTPAQVMSPTTATSWRLVSSPPQSPWPSNSSPNNGSSRMWITMTPRSRRCFFTHTENMSITPNEKACLLVSRRLCPKERGDPLLKEQGDLFWKEVRS